MDPRSLSATDAVFFQTLSGLVLPLPVHAFDSTRQQYLARAGPYAVSAVKSAGK